MAYTTIIAPEAILGIKGYDRISLGFRYGLYGGTWDDDERNSKLDKLIKDYNPHNYQYSIPRIGYISIIKNMLDEYYRNTNMITDIRLPKISLISIPKSDVRILRRHDKTLENFYRYIGYVSRGSGIDSIIDDYLAKKTDENMRFEAIIKGTAIEVESFKPLIPKY